MWHKHLFWIAEAVKSLLTINGFWTIWPKYFFWIAINVKSQTAKNEMVNLMQRTGCSEICGHIFIKTVASLIRDWIISLSCQVLELLQYLWRSWSKIWLKFQWVIFSIRAERYRVSAFCLLICLRGDNTVNLDLFDLQLDLFIKFYYFSFLCFKHDPFLFSSICYIKNGIKMFFSQKWNCFVL